jgi:hypothetical protein
MVKKLQTVDDVIEKLGGFDVVREMTKRNGAFTVPMWKHREKFPPNTFTIMNAALRAKGFSAPATLWGMPHFENASS